MYDDAYVCPLNTAMMSRDGSVPAPHAGRILPVLQPYLVVLLLSRLVGFGVWKDQVWVERSSAVLRLPLQLWGWLETGLSLVAVV